MSELFEQYNKNKDKNIRNKIIEQYYPIVPQIVKFKYGRFFQHNTIDDLISVGTFGLFKAVDNFNYKLSVNPFSDTRQFNFTLYTPF